MYGNTHGYQSMISRWLVTERRGLPRMHSLGDLLMNVTLDESTKLKCKTLLGRGF